MIAIELRLSDRHYQLSIAGIADFSRFTTTPPPPSLEDTPSHWPPIAEYHEFSATPRIYWPITADYRQPINSQALSPPDAFAAVRTAFAAACARPCAFRGFRHAAASRAAALRRISAEIYRIRRLQPIPH
jgi:hypothetical protein